MSNQRVSSYANESPASAVWLAEEACKISFALCPVRFPNFTKRWVRAKDIKAFKARALLNWSAGIRVLYSRHWVFLAKTILVLAVRDYEYDRAGAYVFKWSPWCFMGWQYTEVLSPGVAAIIVPAAQSKLHQSECAGMAALHITTFSLKSGEMLRVYSVKVC